MKTSGKTEQNKPAQNKTVLVIGGGAAGCSAALSLADAGFQVILTEARRHLGGRAASIDYYGSLVDNGQHLVLNACTKTKQLIHRLGGEGYFQKFSAIRFLQPPKGNTAENPPFWTFRSVDFFPGWLRFFPSFLTSNWSYSEKLSLLSMLIRLNLDRNGEDMPFGDWLKNNRVSSEWVRSFLEPAILSALCERPDRVSALAVRKVLFDGILAKHGTEFYLPTVPLRSIFHDLMLAALERNRVQVRLAQPVKRLILSESGRTAAAVQFADGTHLSADRIVLAVPYQKAVQVLEKSGLKSFADTLKTGSCGGISAFHFWLDRPLCREPVVLDADPGQWLFRASFADQSSGERNGGYYHQILISASHRLYDGDYAWFSSETSAAAEAQLHRIFGLFTVKKRFISTVPDAVNIPESAVWGKRPEGTAPFENLRLAGDWLETGWPSTLEGAIRSGSRLAREWPLE